MVISEVGDRVRFPRCLSPFWLNIADGYKLGTGLFTTAASARWRHTATDLQLLLTGPLSSSFSEFTPREYSIYIDKVLPESVYLLMRGVAQFGRASRSGTRRSHVQIVSPRPLCIELDTSALLYPNWRVSGLFWGHSIARCSLQKVKNRRKSLLQALTVRAGYADSR